MEKQEGIKRELVSGKENNQDIKNSNDIGKVESHHNGWFCFGDTPLKETQINKTIKVTVFEKGEELEKEGQKKMDAFETEYVKTETESTMIVDGKHIQKENHNIAQQRRKKKKTKTKPFIMITRSMSKLMKHNQNKVKLITPKKPSNCGKFQTVDLSKKKILKKKQKQKNKQKVKHKENQKKKQKKKQKQREQIENEVTNFKGTVEEKIIKNEQEKEKERKSAVEQNEKSELHKGEASQEETREQKLKKELSKKRTKVFLNLKKEKTVKKKNNVAIPIQRKKIHKSKVIHSKGIKETKVSNTHFDYIQTYVNGILQGNCYDSEKCEKFKRCKRFFVKDNRITSPKEKYFIKDILGKRQTKYITFSPKKCIQKGSRSTIGKQNCTSYKDSVLNTYSAKLTRRGSFADKQVEHNYEEDHKNDDATVVPICKNMDYIALKKKNLNTYEKTPLIMFDKKKLQNETDNFSNNITAYRHNEENDDKCIHFLIAREINILRYYLTHYEIFCTQFIDLNSYINTESNEINMTMKQLQVEYRVLKNFVSGRYHANRKFIYFMAIAHYVTKLKYLIAAFSNFNITKDVDSLIDLYRKLKNNLKLLCYIGRIVSNYATCIAYVRFLYDIMMSFSKIDRCLCELLTLKPFKIIIPHLLKTMQIINNSTSNY